MERCAAKNAIAGALTAGRMGPDLHSGFSQFLLETPSITRNMIAV